MSCLENDKLIDRLVEAFDEWFEDSREEFYNSWAEGDAGGVLALQDGDDQYFEGDIDSLYREIEKEFLSRDVACFDIEELYKNI